MRRKRRTGLIWIIAVAGLFCGFTAGAFLALARDLPQIQSLDNFKPSAITRVYSADQVLLAELFVQKRDPVPLSQIPAYLKSALLTTEDRHFYEHSGLAIKGILRAIVQNIRRGRFAQGASTANNAAVAAGKGIINVANTSQIRLARINVEIRSNGEPGSGIQRGICMSVYQEA